MSDGRPGLDPVGLSRPTGDGFSPGRCSSEGATGGARHRELPTRARAPDVSRDLLEPQAEGLSSALYTSEQAERGEGIFSAVCSACHGGNEFKGPIFAMTWMAEPVGYLFEHISTNMPEDRPGSLSPPEYAAVLAYFLRVNGREPGHIELPADAELLRKNPVVSVSQA